MQKTYYKTASLISNSCKSVALLAGQTAEVAMLAYEYGKNLVYDYFSSFVFCSQSNPPLPRALLRRALIAKTLINFGHVFRIETKHFYLGYSTSFSY